jgi:hypothetical protein
MCPCLGDRTSRCCLNRSGTVSIANGCLLVWRGDAGVRRAQEWLRRGSSVASREGGPEGIVGLIGVDVDRVPCRYWEKRGDVWAGRVKDDRKM